MTRFIHATFPLPDMESIHLHNDGPMGLSGYCTWDEEHGRLFFVEVISFDWNCQKYITPRYTAAEVESVIAPLRQRIAELEAQLSP